MDGTMVGPLLAKDIMTTKLVTLTPDMGLRDAANTLLKKQISGAPVVDDQGTLIGVFSEKDLMVALIDAVYDELPSTEVRAYMTADPHAIAEDLDLLSIAQIFQTKDYRRLPVLADGKLVGQISRRDVMRAVVKLLEPAHDQKTALLYLSALRDSGEAPIE
jgi:CBS domain-containing protein